MNLSFVQQTNFDLNDLNNIEGAISTERHLSDLEGFLPIQRRMNRLFRRMTRLFIRCRRLARQMAPATFIMGWELSCREKSAKNIILQKAIFIHGEKLPKFILAWREPAGCCLKMKNRREQDVAFGKTQYRLCTGPCRPPDGQLWGDSSKICWCLSCWRRARLRSDSAA